MGRFHVRHLGALGFTCAVLLLAWVREVHAGEPLAFEVESAGVVDGGCPGEARPVPIRLRNAGAETWRPESKDRLAYHWRDEAGKMLVRDGERTLLPGAVAPGETVTVDARLRFPSEPGVYLLEWRMVRESVHWYPAADVERRQVVVEGAPDPFAWSLRVRALPRFESGETAEVEVEIGNQGCAGWGPSMADALTYRWLDEVGQVAVFEGLRTPLPDVPPSTSARVTAKVVAPPQEGPHRLQFEPVREGVTWFGPSEAAPAIAVNVAPGPLRWSSVVEPRLGELAARSVATVSVELRNEGTVTWSSKAGDRVSYRWRGADGELVGEGIRTHLPRSVAPGETVALQLRVAAPDLPGEYRFELRPVREHVRWFGPAVSGTSELDVSVQVSALEWSVVDVDVPAWLWVGRTATIAATIRNEGSSAWSSQTADRLTYRLRNEAGELVVAEGRRTEVRGVVEPGQTVTLEAEVPGPPSSGDYVLELRMVREHVAWFGPPKNPDSALLPLSALWQSTLLGLLLGATVVAVVVLRRHPRTRARIIRADPWIWPLWSAVCVWLTSEAFSELSGIAFWDTGRIVGISCGALAGAVVAALGRAPRVCSLTIAVFVSTLAVADLAYTDFFGSLVPITALAAVHHLRDAGTSVLSLMRPSFAWVWMLPASGVALAAGTRRLRPVQGWDRWAPAILLGAAGLPAAGVVASVTASGVGHRVFSEYRNAGRLSVVGAHLFQAARAIRELGGIPELSDAKRREVEAFYRQRTHERREAEPVEGEAGSPPGEAVNVVLIQVEALQHWAVDAQVRGQRVMPFLHGASDEAMRFDAIFDQTAQGRTSDAEYLVLASNHALAHGALSFLRADSQFVTIAHTLRQAGYTTLSAHPYRRGFWNRAALHPRYGFETSSFRRELGPGPEVGWGLADGPFLDRMADRLESTRQPFFAFFITLSLHHPYEDFPVALRELNLGALEDTSVGNYLHAMHHFDTSLASFFRRLDDAGLASNTMVVVYGDHVTGIGETPEVLELAGVASWTPSTATLLHRVPTVVWMPDRSVRGASGRVGGQIDIGPTILHLLSVAAPPSLVGRPLTLEQSWAALPGGSAVGEDRMFVAQGEGIAVEGACFDYPRGSPRPRHDCAALEQQAAEELAVSRAVVDHDLFGVIGATPP